MSPSWHFLLKKSDFAYYSQRTALSKHVYGNTHRSPSVLLIDIEEMVLQIDQRWRGR